MHCVHLHGVKLTSFQEILFQSYIKKKGIAMNTKSARQRKRIVIDFLSHIAK